MRKMVVYFILCLAVLSGVSLGIYFLHYRNIIVCENLVKDRLVDPDSAKFSEIKYSKKGDMICGRYNARNRMGGYVGANLFMCDYKRKSIKSFDKDVVGKEYLLEWLDEARKKARLKGSEEDWNKRQKYLQDILKYAEWDEWESLSGNRDIMLNCGE